MCSTYDNDDIELIGTKWSNGKRGRSTFDWRIMQTPPQHGWALGYWFVP